MKYILFLLFIASLGSYNIYDDSEDTSLIIFVDGIRTETYSLKLNGITFFNGVVSTIKGNTVNRTHEIQVIEGDIITLCDYKGDILVTINVSEVKKYYFLTKLFSKTEMWDVEPSNTKINVN